MMNSFNNASTQKKSLGLRLNNLNQIITLMETGLLHLHNLLRWVILTLLVITILKNYVDVKKPFTNIHRKLGLFTMIAGHITLLLGLYQVIFGRYSWTKIPEGVSVMKDSFYRFFLVEHPVLMILAIVLMTIGNKMAKKQMPDGQKHKRVALFFLLALVAILVATPWSFREIVGRPLMPGM